MIINDFVRNIAKKSYPIGSSIDYETHYKNTININSNSNLNLHNIIKDHMHLNNHDLYSDYADELNNLITNCKFNDDKSYDIVVVKKINKKYNVWNIIVYRFIRITKKKYFGLFTESDQLKYDIIISRIRFG